MSLFCCGISLGLQASEVTALHSLMVLPAVGFLLFAVFVCRDIGQGTWRVRRAASA